MGKFCLYSLDGQDQPGTFDGDRSFSLALEGREAIPDLAHCYGSSNPEANRELFERLYQANTELWCAQTYLFRAGRSSATTWLFRRHYVIPLEGYEEFSICLDLQGNDRAFVGTVHVHADYRRRRLFSRMVAAIRKGDAALHVFSGVHAENHVSIAAHEKIGFRRVGTIRYVRVGPRMWCHVRFPGIARRWRQIRKGQQISVEAEGNRTLSPQ